MTGSISARLARRAQAAQAQAAQTASQNAGRGRRQNARALYNFLQTQPNPMTVTDSDFRSSGIQGLGYNLDPLSITTVWTIRNIKDAWDIELPSSAYGLETFWYTRVVEGMYEAGVLYDEGLIQDPVTHNPLSAPDHCTKVDGTRLKATFFLDPECTIPASRVIHAYIVRKYLGFKIMANRRANPLEYIMDLRDGNVLQAMPFSRYCKVGQYYLRQRADTQSILGMEVGDIGNYSNIFAIKSALVANKGPKKRRVHHYNDLRDLHKSINSVENGAREGEGTLPGVLHRDGTVEWRVRRPDGSLSEDALLVIDLLASVKMFLEMHRLSKWFLLDREDSIQPGTPANPSANGMPVNNVRLRAALANYRASVSGRVAYRFAMPREVIGRYRDNHHVVAYLEEFELCRALVAGMFDVESPYGPYPTHNEDFTEVDADDLIDHLTNNFRRDKFMIIGDLILNALWHSAEQDQLHLFYEMFVAGNLKREHINRALVTDRLFAYNYVLYGPGGTAMVPDNNDPDLGQDIEEFARPTGHIETEWLAFWRQWILNPDRASMAAEWFRRADETEVWVKIVEVCNLYPSAWWSAKFADAVAAVKNRFADGYGTRFEQMWMIDRLGSVCLIIQVFDDTIRGVTEAYRYYSQAKNFGGKEIKEMGVSTLLRRGSILPWVIRKHISPAGIMRIADTPVEFDAIPNGPGMTLVQQALKDKELLFRFKGARTWFTSKREELPWGVSWLTELWEKLTERISETAERSRDNPLGFHTTDFKSNISWDMMGALAGWLFYFTHDIFNYDINFKAYYEEIQRSDLGIYPQDKTFEEYFRVQYPEEILREMHDGEIPEIFQKHSLDKLPLNIWEWLFIPIMLNCRPVLAPECSEIQRYR